jgi:hypothetical protein
MGVAVGRVAAGAGVLWLQLGISNPEARAVAEEAGLRYVEDRCLKVEQVRLLGRGIRSLINPHIIYVQRLGKRRTGIGTSSPLTTDRDVEN